MLHQDRVKQAPACFARMKQKSQMHVQRTSHGTPHQVTPAKRLRFFSTPHACALRCRAPTSEAEARRADVLSRRSRGAGRRKRGADAGANDADSADSDDEPPVAAGRGSGGQGAPTGEALLGELLRAGALTRHGTGSVSMMRLTVPGVGSVVRSAAPPVRGVAVRSLHRCCVLRAALCREGSICVCRSPLRRESGGGER